MISTLYVEIYGVVMYVL